MNYSDEMSRFNEEFWDARGDNLAHDTLTSWYGMDQATTQAVAFLLGSIYTKLDFIISMAGNCRDLAEFHAKEIRDAIGYLLLWQSHSCDTVMYSLLEKIDKEKEDETNEKTECGSTCDHDGQGTD